MSAFNRHTEAKAFTSLVDGLVDNVAPPRFQSGLCLKRNGSRRLEDNASWWERTQHKRAFEL